MLMLKDSLNTILLPKEEIESLVEEHQTAPHERKLQKKLAEEVTIWVHGKEEYEKSIESL